MQQTAYCQTLFQWLQQDKQRMQALSAVLELGLPDCWLAAGFVRNLVWDKLHDYPVATALNDIDVIYFDPVSKQKSNDQALERKLRQQIPLPWSVKNQARMHLRNQGHPYQNSEDAVSRWVEIETAVGVQLDANGQLQLLAPFELTSLFSLTLTPNPKHTLRADFERRIAQKGWLERWPKLRVMKY